MTVNSITSVPTGVLNVIMSYVGITDDYVVYASSGNTYYGYVSGITGNKLITVSRSNNTASYSVSVSETSTSPKDIEVVYPYYTYSNIPEKGVYMASPRASTITCYAVVVTCVLFTVLTIFGRIFAWSKR